MCYLLLLCKSYQWSLKYFLEVNILSCLQLQILRAMSKKCPFPCLFFFVGSVPISKPFRGFCLPLRSLFSLLNVIFFLFCLVFFSFADSLNLSISFLNFISSSNASSGISSSLGVSLRKDLIVLSSWRSFFLFFFLTIIS